jgi:hypothetical protein
MDTSKDKIREILLKYFQKENIPEEMVDELSKFVSEQFDEGYGCGSNNVYWI